MDKTVYLGVLGQGQYPTFKSNALPLPPWEKPDDMAPPDPIPTWQKPKPPPAPLSPANIASDPILNFQMSDPDPDPNMMWQKPTIQGASSKLSHF